MKRELETSPSPVKCTRCATEIPSGRVFRRVTTDVWTKADGTRVRFQFAECVDDDDCLRRLAGPSPIIRTSEDIWGERAMRRDEIARLLAMTYAPLRQPYKPIIDAVI